MVNWDTLALHTHRGSPYSIAPLKHPSQTKLANFERSLIMRRPVGVEKRDFRGDEIMMRGCGLIMLTNAICPRAHSRVCVCVLQAAVRLRSTTVSVGTAWLLGPMASPGSKSTPGRGLLWTLRFPQVRTRWELFSLFLLDCTTF